MLVPRLAPPKLPEGLMRNASKSLGIFFLISSRIEVHHLLLGLLAVARGP